ncbi:MAG TPA: hypothetical protein VEU95_12045 [Micropepsaceae bacterium]|jgi:hypothetical protein|nr:hypothetical protein [Micropepsaceae bacterium]
MKAFVTLSTPLIAAAVLFGANYAEGADANLSGNYKCGPDAKACQWSGSTFTIAQTGKNLEIKNDKGAAGTGTLTSEISVSAGPPWNMLGVISDGNRVIDWSNGTVWRRQ